MDGAQEMPGTNVRMQESGSGKGVRLEEEADQS